MFGLDMLPSPCLSGGTEITDFTPPSSCIFKHFLQYLRIHIYKNMLQYLIFIAVISNSMDTKSISRWTALIAEVTVISIGSNMPRLDMFVDITLVLRRITTFCAFPESTKIFSKLNHF